MYFIGVRTRAKELIGKNIHCVRDSSSTADLTVLSLSNIVIGVSESAVNLDCLEWCFDFFRRKQSEAILPRLNLTCKKSQSFATNTPPVMVAVEFS